METERRSKPGDEQKKHNSSQDEIPMNRRVWSTLTTEEESELQKYFVERMDQAEKSKYGSQNWGLRLNTKQGNKSIGFNTNQHKRLKIIKKLSL